MKRIFLIGYMGAGKTTLGKLLAKDWKLSFIDLDYYIENRYHKSIRDIFTENGEEYFRKIEQNMLHEVSEFENCIISTGGGTPCFYDNMDYMNANGTTVYLKASVEELAARLEVCKQTRPILKDKSGEVLKDFIAVNLNKRELFYQKALHVFTTYRMVSQEEILATVESLKDYLSE